MANYIDAAYFSGINPMNAGNNVGLSSIAPTFGLPDSAPNPQALDIQSQLPDPQFAPNAASYFSWLPRAATLDQEKSLGASNTGSLQYPSNPLQTFSLADSEKAVANPTAKPYFDPNYPEESMVALRNWLAPQVKAGADQSQINRGLYSTGTGVYAENDANSYLNSIAPFAPGEAAAADFQRLYGPDIRNGLVGTGNSLLSHGAYGLPASNIRIDPQIDASGVAGGSHTSDPALIANPNYRPPTSPTSPQSPQFGLFDFSPAAGGGTGAGGSAYIGPGYAYNPNQMPDASTMPWLAPAKPAGT